MDIRNYIDLYLSEAIEVVNKINKNSLEEVIKIIFNIKKTNGRIFFLGVGGSAANASHAVNDFRKIAGIEAYTPTDNVSELTARTNDDGWETVFVNWLKCNKIDGSDCIFVFSVGGGNKEKNVSVNIINALDYAKQKGTKIVGVVGKDGGYTAKVADACIIIPIVNNESITPHTEAFQAVIWHLIVSHPIIKSFEMKWESTK
jgi:D-sedoheptulose 7-phosphate isomerase